MFSIFKRFSENSTKKKNLLGDSQQTWISISPNEKIYVKNLTKKQFLKILDS